MNLSKHEDGTFTLTDETGASIEIMDEDELAEAYIEFERILGAPDTATRYKLLEMQLAKLTQAIVGNWGIADIFALACKRLNTKETSDLITLLQEQKTKAEEAHGSYTDMALGDLEDHPF